MEQLPGDVVFSIALMMDLPEILSLCKTSKRFNRIICENRNFWLRRLQRDYNIDIREEIIR